MVIITLPGTMTKFIGENATDILDSQGQANKF